MEDYEDKPLPVTNYTFIRWFGFDQFTPERAVTSYWVSSKTFFVIRFILALYSTVVFWTYLGLVAAYSDFTSFFSMFTTLTFVGLHAYLVTSCVHHARYLYVKNIDFMVNQPAFLNYLYIYLYSTVITYNILTPVVFWTLLSPGGSSTSIPSVSMWLNVSVHGVSFFLMAFDVIFNRIQLPIRLVVFVIITVLFYMFLAFIIFSSKGIWVYPFLNWDQGPVAALWYFVVAIIVVVGFFIMVFVHWIRDFIAHKMGKRNAFIGVYTAKPSCIKHQQMSEIQQENS
ncbi:MAG: hypothetical protein EXX96DRAFT_550671 [Benjaminiella poitrasii]|nr:MAG: hypothetical protein EXX96DRAFT_550671 [Benjaminiella poitrasii]